MEDWADKFIGTLIPEVPVPFSAEGVPDFGELESFVNAYVRKPVDGVMVGGEIDHSGGQAIEMRLEILETATIDAIGELADAMS